jgi:Skp family chaperone for outer membrane proteins
MMCAISVIIAIAVGTGCKPKPPVAAAPPPIAMKPIATVNIEQITKAMGWDTEIAQGMAQLDSQLRDQLAKRINELNQQVSDTRAGIAKEAHLTPDQTLRMQTASDPAQFEDLPFTLAQRQQLFAANANASMEIQAAQRNYQQQYSRRQTELAQSYENVILPIARRIATQEGFRIVMAEGANIAYHDPATDVSKQVIDELNHGRPAWEQPAQ